VDGVGGSGAICGNGGVGAWDTAIALWAAGRTIFSRDSAAALAAVSIFVWAGSSAFVSDDWIES